MHHLYFSQEMRGHHVNNAIMLAQGGGSGAPEHYLKVVKLQPCMQFSFGSNAFGMLIQAPRSYFRLIIFVYLT